VNVEVLTFEQFIKENNLKYINFLKTDCEGGEYSIFTKENLEYITNYIKKIVRRMAFKYS
jgi:FkbM family methyltransferase